MKTITLLTDFGEKDTYVAQMKGVILSICRDANIIDITHEIIPQNIEEGAFLLMNTVSFFPKNTIHVAVVDPGVGTDRRGIVIETEDFKLVGPDNGLLIPSAKKYSRFRVFEITNQNYLLPSKTHTFHGRDVFAPVAAYLAQGIGIESVGEEIYDYVDLDIWVGEIKEDRIVGKIMHIDRFGNAITNIEGKTILEHLEYGSRVLISVESREYEMPFVKSYGFVGKGEKLLTIGGNGFLEISMNQGNASQEMELKIGSKVIISL